MGSLEAEPATGIQALKESTGESGGKVGQGEGDKPGVVST